MKLFFLFIFSCSFITSSSQYLEKVSGRALYFKAGINITNVVNWDDGMPTYSLIRPVGGIGVYQIIGKPERTTTALAAEVNFSGQGFAMKNNSETIKARATYLNFSVLIRQYFGHFYITAGPEAGILLAANEKAGSRREYVPQGIYSKSGFNGIAGIGMNFGSKNERQPDFGLELTYKRGFNKVRRDFSEARHSVINFSMFIPISLFADTAAP